MRLTSFAFAACALTLAASAVPAADVVPPVLLSVSRSIVPDRQIDILGLVPGMTVKDVKAQLTQLAGTPDERFEQTVLYDSGVTITGTPFTKWLNGGTEDDRTTAMFSGVSSGNRLVFVRREAEYKASLEAPVYSTFVASLLEKYGEPTYRRDWAGATALMWTYKEGRPVSCDPNGNPQCLDPDDAMEMVDQTAASFDVIVYAAVGAAIGDATRVGLFKMSSTDLSLKKAADEADEAGLRPALDAAIAASVANAPKPSL